MWLSTVQKLQESLCLRDPLCKLVWFPGPLSPRKSCYCLRNPVLVHWEEGQGVGKDCADSCGTITISVELEKLVRQLSLYVRWLYLGICWFFRWKGNEVGAEWHIPLTFYMSALLRFVQNFIFVNPWLHCFWNSIYSTQVLKFYLQHSLFWVMDHNMVSSSPVLTLGNVCFLAE